MMNKEKACEIARGSGWLSEQDTALQTEFLERCQLRTYNEREAIYHMGDAYRGMFGLISGVIRIEFAAAGDEYKIIGVKQPVFWFGQGASLRRREYIITVSAGTPLTVLHLPHSEFERLMENATFCRALALLTLDHFEETSRVVTQLLIGDVENRITARLALLAGRTGAQRSAVIPVTQSDLAEMCGVSRPTVQQVLSSLEKRGLIKAGYRRIEVFDPEALLRKNGEGPFQTSSARA